MHRSVWLVGAIIGYVVAIYFLWQAGQYLMFALEDVTSWQYRIQFTQFVWNLIVAVIAVGVASALLSVGLQVPTEKL